MMGKITVWRMSEEERLAYIAKHPIRPTEKLNGSTFANLQTDYKWRPKANTPSVKCRKGLGK